MCYNTLPRLYVQTQVCSLNTKLYLSKFKKELEERFQFKDGVCKWYSLSIPQNLNLMQDNKEKIFTPLYSKGNKFGLDNGGKSGDYYILTDAFVLVKKREINLKYLLAVLNSSLMNFYNSKFGKLKRDGYYEYSRNTLCRFPIKEIETKADQKIELEIISLVDKVIALKDELKGQTLQTKVDQLCRHIDYCKQQIDIKVNQLYRLTKEEIGLFENA